VKIFCVGRQADVDARLTNGAEVYPHRPDLAQKPLWKCACGLYVGCHPGTEKPLGVMPTKELSKARGHIHALIDPVWKNRRMSRRKIYSKLSKFLGREYHTGEIRSVEEAREIYRAALQIVKGLPNGT
jgi:hypothetical protein